MGLVEREAAISEGQALSALGRVLAAVTGSAFELEPMLERIAAEASGLCRADLGSVFLRDGGLIQFVAGFGGSPEHRAYERANPFATTRDTLAGRVFLENGPVHIPDVLADAEYRWPGAAIDHYRTLLGVPIRTDDGLIGAFGIARVTVSPFSDAEIELVGLFADQAAVTIRLARLLGDTHEALERETAIGEVLQSISRSTFDLDAVLQTVLDSVVRLTHADQGNILRERGGMFRARAFSSDVPAEFREIISNIAFGPDRGSGMGRALLERRPIQIVDVLADPEYRLTDAQKVVGFRTLLAAPLLRDGEPIGVLGVWRKEVREFTAAEMRLLATFADQAVLAIENVRLFETIDRQRVELTRYAPQAAELLSSAEGQALLVGHRREITALFADLRGFTAFAEQAEPEEVLGVLRQYHAVVGELAVKNGGSVEHFAGDGLMVFFNDPAPVVDHQFVAVRTASEMRDRFGALSTAWRKRGFELGLGIGIAAGFATLGRIGFEGRYDYAAIGNSVILASRLSGAAKAGQLLVSQRVFAAVEDLVEADAVEDLELKGFSHAMTAYDGLCRHITAGHTRGLAALIRNRISLSSRFAARHILAGMDLATAANVATTLTVVVAVVFGITELRRWRQERRDQAAIEIVRSVQSQEIHEAASRILKLPNDADPEIVRGDATLQHAATLVHFAAEMFGSLVFEGVVDLHVLDRMNGGWIRDCWHRLRGWVEAERVAEGRVNVGEWWQWLVERLEADPDPSKAVGAHVYYRDRR